MDFSQPLCRGRVVSLEEGGRVWVSFKYERLPNICYWCGRLYHDDKDCPLWIKSKGSFRRQDKQFGSFMRATQIAISKKKKKKVVHVSGFFEDRESHYSATRDVPEVNSKYPTTTSPPSMTVPPSSDEHTDMETSVLVEDTINTP